MHAGEAYEWGILVHWSLLTGWFVLSARQVTRNEVVVVQLFLLWKSTCRFLQRGLKFITSFYVVKKCLSIFEEEEKTYRVCRSLSKKSKNYKCFKIMEKHLSIFGDLKNWSSSFLETWLVFVDYCICNWKNLQVFGSEQGNPAFSYRTGFYYYTVLLFMSNSFNCTAASIKLLLLLWTVYCFNNVSPVLLSL